MRRDLSKIYRTESPLLNSQPLSPKAVGVENGAPAGKVERKGRYVYNVALVVKWASASKSRLSTMILWLHSPL